MKSESILKNVQESYLSFESYSDVGSVDIVPSFATTLIEFKTFFSRPSKVRFEWRDWHPYFGKDRPPNENIIWSDGDNSYKCFSGDRTRTQNLSLAIGGATGVSSGAVHKILKLLMPSCIALNSAWYDMHEVRILQDESVHGFSCYHLLGTVKRVNDTEAWISRDDLLVRRIRATNEINAVDNEKQFARRLAELTELGIRNENLPKPTFGVSQYYQEYNYREIKINSPLPEELFKFDFPEAANS